MHLLDFHFPDDIPDRYKLALTRLEERSDWRTQDECLYCHPDNVDDPTIGKRPTVAVDRYRVPAARLIAAIRHGKDLHANDWIERHTCGHPGCLQPLHIMVDQIGARNDRPIAATITATTKTTDDTSQVFLTTKELADRWRMSTKSIHNARSANTMPIQSVRLGSSVRYRLADIVEYENRQLEVQTG